MKFDIFTAQPEEYVESVLATVGKVKVTHGSFGHEVMVSLFQWKGLLTQSVEK